MSQLKPQTELKIFFNELLSPFDLTIDDEILKSKSITPIIKEKVAQASFSTYLNFIGSFSIIIKHMGNLLN